MYQRTRPEIATSHSRNSSLIKLMNPKQKKELPKIIQRLKLIENMLIIKRIVQEIGQILLVKKSSNVYIALVSAFS